MTPATTVLFPQLLLDLFAGPGGWSEGLRSIGLADVGLEWDRDACRTRAAAGHKTIRCDVARYPVEPFVGKVRGLIASPPCQAFSMAGKRQGMLDLGRIHAAVEAARSGWRDELRAGPWADERSALILEPLRWAWALRPKWIACEQVPPALPVWEHMADVLRGWGYDATAVRLLAADYGVPQTRLRAFLLAHRERVNVPAPTHARAPSADLFGDQLAPWVSMASALGWVPGERAMDRRVGGFAEGADAISDNRPAPTLSLSHGREVWVRTGTNTMKHSRKVEDMVPYERSCNEPAPTLDAKVGGAWKLRVGNQERASEAPAEAPAPTLLFGDRVNDVRWCDTGPATDPSGSFPISIAEAALLQSFPADYPFQGTKTARFRQVGDAVPPLLAAHVIGALAA